MTELSLSLVLPVSKSILFKAILDFEKYPLFMPVQLKYVKVLEKDDSKIITTEKFLFKTIFKKEIIQSTHHRVISSNEIQSKILDGPAKGTTIKIFISDENEKSKIELTSDLKLSIKYKIFIPIIKRYFKMVSTAILYKMVNHLNN